jgi:hypothetical protein
VTITPQPLAAGSNGRTWLTPAALSSTIRTCRLLSTLRSNAKRPASLEGDLFLRNTQGAQEVFCDRARFGGCLRRGEPVQVGEQGAVAVLAGERGIGGAADRERGLPDAGRAVDQHDLAPVAQRGADPAQVAAPADERAAR